VIGLKPAKRLQMLLFGQKMLKSAKK